jgi:transcriptional regulator with XRE-family HTH domain
MKKYAELLKRARQSYSAIKQRAMRAFVSDAVTRMDALQMSRADLAAKIGASPAYVSKILRGDVNFTIESMAKIAHAVGGRLSVNIIDENRAVTASKFSVDVPIAMAHANAGVMRGAAIVRDEQIKKLDLSQAFNPMVGQDDHFAIAA